MSKSGSSGCLTLLGLFVAFWIIYGIYTLVTSVEPSTWLWVTCGFIVFVIVVLAVKKTATPVKFRVECSESLYAKLRGLPQCSLEIAGDKESQEIVHRLAYRQWKAGNLPSDAANLIAKTKQGKQLIWPSYDRWKIYLMENRQTFEGSKLLDWFFGDDQWNEFQFERKRRRWATLELEAYVDSLYGLFIVEERLGQMKECGLTHVEWFVPPNSCCPICQSLNREVMSLDVFRRVWFIHPCCEVSPNVPDGELDRRTA